MRTQESHGRQRGFALILAILALMLLTFLGLTLATTTSSELQIATNYRWSQQAYYNAEAGIEAAKVLLRGIPNNWSTVLPTPRQNAIPAAQPNGWASNLAAPKCTGAACGNFAGSVRNYEGIDCDSRNGMGYGVVLLGNENVTQYQANPNYRMDGAFTVWVRRDVIPNPALPNNLIDEAPPAVADGDSKLVLVSEGVAPQAMNAVGTGASLQAARAVRILQVKLNYGSVTRGCQAAEGQTGTTAGGGNFGACAPLDTGSIDQALGGGGGSRGDSGAK